MAFKANLEMWIPWRDGAEVRVVRLNKEEDRALQKRVNEQGAEIRKNGDGVSADEIEKAIHAMSVMEKLYAIVREWKGIEDGNGNSIPFNDSTKLGIFEYMVSDSAFLEKLISFYRGPLGNSKPGLTASSNGNGTQDSAVNARNKKD